MFQVYHSNSLLVLKDLLVELIRRDPLPDPFVAEQILVQSPGMAQWLKLELAAASGIAASVDFPLPASFLWRSFASVLEGVPERSAYNKEAMAWKLMKVLPTLLNDPTFKPLQGYLENDPDRYRLYQLCNKVADTFDQYLVYRPDWIEDWEQGGDMAAAKQPWQPLLWRALQHHTEQLQQPHWHRANMFSEFVKGLRQRQGQTALPKRLFVFGISALPQNFIQALQAMGEQVDVHLMVTNPCQYYWGDILSQAQLARINRRWFSKPDMQLDESSVGNPLLASMGKLGRDYLYELQTDAGDEITAFADPERHCLLNAVQQDVLDLENPTLFPADPGSSQHKRPLRQDDHSLVLHSCHSPLREVEVLHDQLLAMFENDAELKPRDIIIMVPDVASYSPYIEAVFSSVSSERYIPYSISDRSSRQESPLLLSFEKLLRLHHARLTVSEVLELLEVPAVMRRFDIDDADFQRLRLWIDQVNIRWGLDAEQRSLWDLPLFEQNSWRFGLRRMLSGYALGDSALMWQGIAPFSEIEGLEAELLGKLADFIDQLADTRACFEAERPLEEWISAINQVLELYYLADEQDELALNTIRNTLQGLQEQLTDAQFDSPLSAAILSEYLISGIGSQRSSQRFMMGAVNFCTLMPMRSIPFPVVCLLGMNDGAYPRSMPPIGFDLMNDQPRRGDRSRRDDDRYLFLEALLSAQSKLYISYVGRSVKDNYEKIPSVLVSELLDYVSQGYALESDLALAPQDAAQRLLQHLTVQHPLVAFSPTYFDHQSGLFSYASEWLPAAGAQRTTSVPFLAQPLAPVADLEQLELSQLIAFFKAPSRSFFNQRLKVSFRQSQLEALDEEPFDMDGLEAYLVRQRYLETALAEGDLSLLEQSLKAEGGLPVAQLGDKFLGKIRHDCTELAEKIRPLRDGTPQRLEFYQQVDGLSLEGWLDQCFPAHMLRYRPAQVNANDRLSTWIEHLALCCCPGGVKNTVFRGLSGKVNYRTVPAQQALEELNKLVQLYREGQTAPLAFDAYAAQTYFQQMNKDPETALEKVEARFYGDSFRIGLQDDPYVRRAFPEFKPFAERFVTLAETIYAPMLAYIDEGDDD